MNLPIFLTAEWRNLIMANYLVEPSILKKYLPPFTELDLWQGRCYVSLVGFMFLNTKIRGVSFPFHRNFEEVNLRFYVRYKEAGEWKRGVVFMKEIVPRRAITLVANVLYGENYITLPMQHSWEQKENGAWHVAYRWKVGGEFPFFGTKEKAALAEKTWNVLEVNTLPAPMELVEGSEEEFITQHFWGYTKTPGSLTSEYQVEHPAWRVFQVDTYNIMCSGEKLYGKPFGEILDGRPQSVFMAEGSGILVRKGRVVNVRK